MKIFLNLLFLITATNVFGQYLVVTAIGNDCVKCQAQISMIDDDDSFPPIFFVFQKSYQQDSTALKDIFPKSSNNFIYSDSIYNLINPKTTTLTYVNSEGLIRYKKSLADFGKSDLDSIKALYFFEGARKSNRPQIQTFQDGWRITKNQLTGKLTVDSGSEVYNFVLDSTITSKAIQAINKHDKGFYDETEKAIASGEAQPNFVKANVEGYSFRNRVLYYIVIIPFISPPSEEEIANGLKGRITNYNVMVANHLNGKQEFNLIDLDETGTGKGFLVPFTSFSSLGNGSFVFFRYPMDVKDNVRFISLFSLKNDIIKFDKMVDNKYPDIYFQSELGFRILPNFYAYDYPYYSTGLALSISDISTGKDYPFIPQFTVDYNKIKTPGFMQKLYSGQEKMPIANRFMFKNLKGDKLYLVSLQDDINYISIFKIAKDGVSYIESINLKTKSINVADFAVFEFDKQKDMILIEDKMGYMRSLPMSLLSSQN